MAQHKYAHQTYDGEKMARAVGRDLSISTKQAIEICSTLRRKNLQQAKALLEEVIAMKRPIWFKRFTNGIGHRKGPGAAGAYPVKASTEFLKLLNSVEVNAQNKGLNTGQLSIIHICAQKASKPMHHGRQRRSEFKRSHIEVVVAEEKIKEKQKRQQKPEAKPETKEAKHKVKPQKEAKEEKKPE
ncbi:MAG: 50S ribosomal protein L22 [Nanoarchaeota archaeon]|nr:50S ribosomal protein L22 [Nanoarchaeota archaeon]